MYEYLIVLKDKDLGKTTSVTLTKSSPLTASDVETCNTARSVVVDFKLIRHYVEKVV